jgi:pSer/pThr/pTyr-binding forkhead associated (FHA) protein
MGRDASCHILLDDAKVSRRHAQLTVKGDQVSIEDLQSMNGLYVNGGRVNGVQPLFDGDWITAGSEELEVCIGEIRTQRQAPSTVDEFTPVPASTEAENRRRISEPPEDGEITERSRALEILASIADRALETGRLQDAEDLLKTTLLDVAQESSLGHVIEPDSLEFAVHYALRLASAQGKNRWFDYALDLLVGQRVPCNPRVADALSKAIGRLAVVDTKRLEAYAKACSKHKGPEAEASTARAQQVLEAALRKGRAP